MMPIENLRWPIQNGKCIGKARNEVHSGPLAWAFEITPNARGSPTRQSKRTTLSA